MPDWLRWHLPGGQIVRIAVAVLLIGVAGWLLYPQLESDIRSDGTVNARIVPITSPIAGHVLVDLPGNGEAVLDHQLLTQIGGSPEAGPLLAQLDTDRAASQATLVAQQQQLDVLQSLQDRLEREVAAYQERAIERIRHELSEATARVKLWQASREERVANTNRVRELVSKGYAPLARLEAAVSQEQQAAQEIERARADAARLEAEAAAARQGVFLGESRNDVPYSRQRLDEVLIIVARLTQEVAVAQARLAALDRQYELEKQRAQKRTDADVFIPLNGFVWRRLVKAGDVVERGTRLAEILDCSVLTIQIAVPEKMAGRIRPETAVEVRLQGTRERIPATVREIRGMLAVVPEENMAARPPSLDRDEVLVTVELGASSLGVRPGAACGVGRRAQVIFPDGLQAWLGGLLGREAKSAEPVK